MRKLTIHIGHSAYSGSNAPAVAHSVAQAIDILRDRGAKRDDARRAVRAALRGSWSVCALGFNSCELRAPQESVDAYQFHYLISEKDRAYLRHIAQELRNAGREVRFYVQS